MTRSITRTVYGSALQTARHLGMQYQTPANSTLNEWVAGLGGNVASPMTFRGLNGATVVQPVLQSNQSTGLFSLAAYNPVTDTQGMYVNYLAIGNKGAMNYTGADATQPSYTGPIPHMARHSGLYGQIPFVLRAYNASNPNWDIPATGAGVTQQNYRHRSWLMIGGTLYVGYFLRVISMTPPTETLQYNSVSNGVVTTTTFSPTTNDLFNPTQPGNPGAPIATTGDYLSVSAALPISFSAAEISEMVNVATVLYNNPNQAVISELALCQGIDKTVTYSPDGSTSSSAGSAPTMIEAAGVQVSTFLDAYYSIPYTSQGLDINLDLGATEPLYGVAAV